MSGETGLKGFRKNLMSSWFFEFFGYGSIAVASYLALYFERVGYTRFEIGVLMASSPLAVILSAPLLGRLADFVSSRSNLLFLMGILAAGFSWMLRANFGFTLDFLIAFAMFSFIMSSIPIGESAMLSSPLIGEHRFNKVRLMGTIGFAMISLLTGYLVTHGFILLFFLLSLNAVVMALAGWRLPNARSEKIVVEESFIRTMLKNWNLRSFFVLSFFQMMTMGYHFSFFPIYANHVFHDERVLGYLILIQTLAEIPVLLTLPLLRRRFPMRVLGIMISLGFSTRWFLTSFFFQGIAAFFIQLLHGLGVVPLAILSMMEINRTIPVQMASRSQTFYWSVLNSGQIIGSVVGGAVVQNTSLRTGYLLATLISTSALIMFIGLCRGKDKEKRVN